MRDLERAVGRRLDLLDRFAATLTHVAAAGSPDEVMERLRAFDLAVAEFGLPTAAPALFKATPSLDAAAAVVEDLMDRVGSITAELERVSARIAASANRFEAVVALLSRTPEGQA